MNLRPLSPGVEFLIHQVLGVAKVFACSLTPTDGMSSAVSFFSPGLGMTDHRLIFD